MELGPPGAHDSLLRHCSPAHMFRLLLAGVSHTRILVPFLSDYQLGQELFSQLLKRVLQWYYRVPHNPRSLQLIMLVVFEGFEIYGALDPAKDTDVNGMCPIVVSHTGCDFIVI